MFLSKNIGKCYYLPAMAFTLRGARKLLLVAWAGAAVLLATAPVTPVRAQTLERHDKYKASVFYQKVRDFQTNPYSANITFRFMIDYKEEYDRLMALAGQSPGARTAQAPPPLACNYNPRTPTIFSEAVGYGIDAQCPGITSAELQQNIALRRVPCLAQVPTRLDRYMLDLLDDGPVDKWDYTGSSDHITYIWGVAGEVANPLPSDLKINIVERFDHSSIRFATTILGVRYDVWVNDDWLALESNVLINYSALTTTTPTDGSRGRRGGG